jgi:hypothetical protein
MDMNDSGQVAQSQSVSSADAITNRDASRQVPVKQLLDVKNHVVQIENMILYVICFQLLLLLLPLTQRYLGVLLASLLPFVLLSLLPLVMPVRNPQSSLRARLKYGISLAGFGGMVGGASTGLALTPVMAPVGTLIGGSAGFLIGFIAGKKWDEQPQAILSQGDARKFLISLTGRDGEHPDLELKTILDATEFPPIKTDCVIPMFQLDNVPSCRKQDVIDWVTSRCWVAKAPEIPLVSPTA